jgi:hypothetical protein
MDAREVCVLALGRHPRPSDASWSAMTKLSAGESIRHLTPEERAAAVVALDSLIAYAETARLVLSVDRPVKP